MRIGKKILIVEGPAGSGKSFVANHLATTIGAAHVASSLGKRGFDTHEEPALASAVNDYGKMLRAITVPEYVVVVERLILSQMVYGGLRDPDLPHNQYLSLGEHWVAERFNALIGMAISEVNWRLGPTFMDPEKLSLSILIVLPDAEQIEAQRKDAGKGYPWPAESERILYQMVAETLTARGADVLVFPNKNEAQLNRLTGAVSVWSRIHYSQLQEAWRPNR